jgi:hypothetical protein
MNSLLFSSDALFQAFLVLVLKVVYGLADEIVTYATADIRKVPVGCP